MTAKRGTREQIERTNSLLESMHETLKQIEARLPNTQKVAPIARPSPDAQTRLRNTALEILSTRHADEFRELLRKLNEDTELGVFKS